MHTTESMQLDGGLTMEAESVIRELNVAMKWLEYPGLKNGAVSANDLEFAVPGGIGQAVPSQRRRLDLRELPLSRC